MQKNKDKHEELPIEEFENDNQDIRKEFLEKFGKKKEDIKKSVGENLRGGKSDYKSIKEIAKHHNVSLKKIAEQVSLGLEVELEHTDDEEVALEITKDHLYEIPDYYTRLKEMEDQAK